MEIVPIIVTSRSSGEKLGQIDLPSFCIQHMKMTPGSANAQTMIGHIEKKCGCKVRQMFFGNHEVTTELNAAEMEGKKEIIIAVVVMTDENIARKKFVNKTTVHGNRRILWQMIELKKSIEVAEDSTPKRMSDLRKLKKLCDTKFENFS